MNSETMNEYLCNANALRAAGFAVVIFYPDELSGVCPRAVENRLVELGTEIVDILLGE